MINCIKRFFEKPLGALSPQAETRMWQRLVDLENRVSALEAESKLNTFVTQEEFRSFKGGAIKKLDDILENIDKKEAVKVVEKPVSIWDFFKKK